MVLAVNKRERTMWCIQIYDPKYGWEVYQSARGFAKRFNNIDDAIYYADEKHLQGYRVVRVEEVG